MRSLIFFLGSLSLLSAEGFSQVLPWQHHYDQFLGCYNILKIGNKGVIQNPNKVSAIYHGLNSFAKNEMGDPSPILYISPETSTGSLWGFTDILPEVSEITSTPDSVKIIHRYKEGSHTLEMFNLGHNLIKVVSHYTSSSLELLFERTSCPGPVNQRQKVIHSEPGSSVQAPKLPFLYPKFRSARIRLDSEEETTHFSHRHRADLTYILRKYPALILENKINDAKPFVEYGIFYMEDPSNQKMFDELDQVISQYVSNLKFNETDVTLEVKVIGEASDVWGRDQHGRYVHTEEFLSVRLPIELRTPLERKTHFESFSSFFEQLRAHPSMETWKSLFEANPIPDHDFKWRVTEYNNDELRCEYLFGWYSDPRFKGEIERLALSAKLGSIWD